ncbi:MAG: hydrolase [Alphaproteobacteria bacterium HGW-Alphaproteobacteria-2]|nr:MAG: hydrolase [Alphaproteobacteria bacterium HGW-Alphaproteobacteria-2]
MRLVSYSLDGQSGTGCLDAEDKVRDLTWLTGPGGMNALIEAAEDLLPRARAALEQQRLPLVAGARLVAPVPQPVRNIFCAGKNYFAHAHEFHDSGFDSTGGEAVPEFPIIFTKATTSVIGPGAPVPASSDPTASVDYEGELAVVIGRGGREIPRERALGHVFGYVIVNDITSRELQKRHGQWVLGKGMDGFCPMGPWIATPDETGPLDALTLRTEVNGESRQEARIADLIFDVPALIAAISERITLLPGDIIATGTAPGVGIGFTPPKYLKPGDRVAVTIDRLGRLENPII